MGPVHLRRMRRAGKAAAATLAVVGRELRAGMSTADIDRLVRADTRRRGGRPSQLGYEGFPAAVCTSRNHVVCHGIPSATDLLEDGDIVNVDVTTCLDGVHGDTSATFVLGVASPEARHLVETARRCRDAGVAAVRPGGNLREVAAAVERVAEAAGCSVVGLFGGHGIGRAMHEPPFVSHTLARAEDRVLRPGMCFTVEPMINLGGPDVDVLADGWTVVTRDRSLSAQFEHTVLVTDTGVEVLTAG